VSHDMIAIGGSAGALEVLLKMVGDLPARLAATIFVALHTQPDRPSSLPELIGKHGRLPASHPLHREPIKPGHIYIAPPDNHLLVRPGFMEVVRGPKENGQRPATDALLRTASSAYGPRVIGVVLSGYLDCGTAGMMSVKARGGVSVVQDPLTALAADMPRSVVDKVVVDHIASPDGLARLLADLVQMPAARPLDPDAPVRQLEGSEKGTAADVVCPLCHGVLSETQAGTYHHFRCHVGHAFTLRSLVQEQSEETEQALWAAVRSLEESASLSQRLSLSQGGQLAPRFAEKAATMRQQAEHIRRILLAEDLSSPGDATKVD
jgi:two-component system, chemotaxis family, protein-glutamate methylesterase/glutaminase